MMTEFFIGALAGILSLIVIVIAADFILEHFFGAGEELRIQKERDRLFDENLELKKQLSAKAVQHKDMVKRWSGALARSNARHREEVELLETRRNADACLLELLIEEERRLFEKMWLACRDRERAEYAREQTETCLYTVGKHFHELEQQHEDLKTEYGLISTTHEFLANRVETMEAVLKTKKKKVRA